MYKFLVVGCGGSGGSTLAYMMDQLRSDLAAHGIDRIPAGWQFVHVDVPNAPDTVIPGIGNVVEQGGAYIGTAPQSGSYSVLDNGLSQTLADAGALGEIGTWAPREPHRITIPIGNGAGQMRAVGRAITLTRASAVYQGLERAMTALNTVEANSEMFTVAERVPGVGTFAQESRPVVLVVSSMAGGAGASMALDVCRLLAMIPGVDPGLTGVFMVTPDVFDLLPDSARGGVRPNALAMLGEIVAAQTGAADAHDNAILNALGHRSGVVGEAPFARVFPVGRFVGAERVQFGDGSPRAVYRGLGRGLAALISAESASNQFVTFDLANVSDPSPANLDSLGWGSDANRIPWGAFGFSSLSMGRDRYRHYAAQRLARCAADRLREGHLQRQSTSSGVDQIKALLDSQWSRIAQSLGLPEATGSLSTEQIASWITGTAFPSAQAALVTARISDEHVAPFVPVASGLATHWLSSLRQFVVQRKVAVIRGVDEATYQWAFTWAQELHQRLVDQVDEAVTLFGLPYARALLARVESSITEQLLDGLSELSRTHRDLGQLPAQFESEVTNVRGTMTNGPALTEHFVDQYRSQVRDAVYARSAGLARDVLLSCVGEVLVSIRAALSEALLVLEQAAQTPPAASSLANVATEYYTAWPSESDPNVPERFGVADNEILLTPASGFDRQFEADLPRALGGEGLRQFTGQTLEATVRMVISGRWPVSAGREAPEGLIEVAAPWRPSHFNRDPSTGEPLTPSRGQYVIHVAAAELVDRALGYVSRPGESFEDFCTMSLKDYARGADLPPSGLPVRHADIVAKFNEALSRALPLTSINSDAVSAIHGTPTAYRYKFSTVPFSGIPDLADALAMVVAQRPNIAAESRDAFGNALGSDDGITKIDLFGSYRNYSPLVFDSLLVPVAKQWAGTVAHGREDFWSNRRARPLAASLPMSDAERHAMVAGWYVGQITGEIRLPESPYTAPVEIWDDEASRWLSFPSPLLTPPSRFHGKSIDWLPAVLESVLIAIARAHDVPVLSSLRPYQVLRRGYDATSQRPLSGLAERSAEQVIASWLATGQTRSGAPSRTGGDTPQERFDKASTWLAQINTFAGTNYVAATVPGATGGGPMSKVTSRKQASQAPIFRDLAIDIVHTTNVLAGVLDAARTRADNLVLPMVHGGASTAPEPDFGPF